MDEELIKIYLDFTISSLYGKIGGADIEYQLIHYN